MTLGRLVLRSLVYHWRTGVAVIFGLGVATAVITGSLVIGDSVTGSLRDIALSRLGSIDHALAAPQFFRRRLATELKNDPGASDIIERISPMIATTGAAKEPESGAIAPDVSVLGIEAEFWGFYDEAAIELSGRDCAVSAALAKDLQLHQGDYLLVTAHSASKVSLDTLFARRELQETAPSMRLKVKRVLDRVGAGDFRLDAQSAPPRNVFLSIDWLAQRLDKSGRANVLLAKTAAGSGPQVADELGSALSRACAPADYGLRIEANPKQGYVQVTSDGVVLDESQVAAARAAAGDVSARIARTSMYLATTIANAARGNHEIAYAVIAAVEQLEPFSFTKRAGDHESDEYLWLNTWAAEDLGARLGDEMKVSYLVPQRDGTYETASTELTVRGIVEMKGPAADPQLAPDVEGITDADTIDNWHPPFPIDMDRITDRDEEYWDRYRATPKAFTSTDVIRQMWRSAAGNESGGWVTSVRIARRDGSDLQRLEREFTEAMQQRLDPADSGLAFRPVRTLALEASEGTSDFGQLFFGLSMFLVFAGAGLAAMLMRLSIDRRASDAGIMLACGCDKSLVLRALLWEGGLLTVLGTLIGVPGGIAYASQIIAALGGWWSGAMGTAGTLWLHVSSGSVVIGAASGLAVGMMTVLWSTRRLTRTGVLELLAGLHGIRSIPAFFAQRPAFATLVVLSFGAAALLIAAAGGAMAPQNAFFAIGGVLLLATLAACSLLLSAAARAVRPNRSLGRLALRNAGASSGRSLLVIGLLSAATFVIVTVAANTRDFTRMDYTPRDSGAGGFALRAVSSVPLSYDPATPEGREKLGFTPEDEKILQGTEIMSLLLSPGDDVSCLNMMKPTKARVLGVPEEMIRRGGFSPTTGRFEPQGNPWSLLQHDEIEGAIPAFGDADSVRWTLHLGLGDIYRMPGEGEEQIQLRFVGLLPGSIFQRELLVSESNFRDLFPSVNAPAYFLIDTPHGKREQIAEVLRRRLGEMGLKVRTTREVLNEFMEVQNTYLSMFLALGGLGLILGTVGLVAVLMRGALERRSELAIMLATGFRRTSLASLLVLENGGLLITGLICGTVTALIAVAPHLASPEARVDWGALTAVLAAIVIVGLATCVVAVYTMLRGELIPALRRE